ncbi:M20/M25/M40 family metallo-hydrolase [Leeuwenhoekiella nanhaiensis]|uniref:Carboxypeptidase Q n=1 Tax=Leeuwenhoekiella nanhaiensis TaxID=1655491 RepID=A0A2G1VPF1_9FLAO|nr:M20/M25/M40 family metallo-hydrolase [Leeuwenhoekiella nanhaiensis]PHQ28624.1 peptidase M28 family protein [Leeuwenhoekiella nanhaiensis]
MKKLALFLVVFCGLTQVQAQTTKDSLQLRNFYDLSLLNGQSYQWLDALSNDIGARLSGSAGAEKAVQWAKAELEAIGLDKVWLQPVMVPKWERGAPEKAWIDGPDGNIDVPVCALGGSIATAADGITAPVIEVQGLDDLAKYGEDQIKGKIVFYNRPMQADLIQTFSAYGGCVDQRYSGAREAAKYGAVGVIVRSMNLRMDDLPHTGAMSYGDLPNEQRIPAAAISTNGAALLSKMLKKDKDTRFYLKMNCQNYEDVPSFNVIGEITGSEKPDEIMVVGGHLDSWDLGDGSHDDGAGVVQSMEVLRLMKAANYKPKHSIRVVLFMNEENGLRGGNKYAEVATEKGERHVFALESDAGGFTPRGFSFDADAANFEQIQSWIPLFKPYLIHYFELGGSGADIGPLKGNGTVLAGLRPDSQRYFDHHHASNDTFDAVNKRELELGAATMTSLVYLMDTYGVKPAPITNEAELKD